MRRLAQGVVALVAATSVALVATPPVVAAGSGTGERAARSAYAPLDRPGPRLHVSTARLRRAIVCHGGLHYLDKELVLLVPDTGLTPHQNYSWNWENLFLDEGRSYCKLTLPHRALGDIAGSAEYVVYALRYLHRRTGQRVAVMGHGQGGVTARWALRFWPDTRRMVDDMVSFGAPNHGARLDVPPGYRMPAATWQQQRGSRFLAALNSRAETFAGISYTQIYTRHDQVLRDPRSGPSSAALTTGRGRIRNVAVQQLCPGNLSDHLTVGTSDSAAYGLARDALTHRGPANPRRVDRAVCTAPYMPGVVVGDAETYLPLLAAAPGLLAVAAPVNTFGAPTYAA